MPAGSSLAALRSREPAECLTANAREKAKARGGSSGRRGEDEMRFPFPAGTSKEATKVFKVVSPFFSVTLAGFDAATAHINTLNWWHWMKQQQRRLSFPSPGLKYLIAWTEVCLAVCSDFLRLIHSMLSWLQAALVPISSAIYSNPQPSHL